MSREEIVMGECNMRISVLFTAWTVNCNHGKVM